MTEIEKMQKYIDRTGIAKGTLYAMSFNETMTLAKQATASGFGDAFMAINFAFTYGRAKGYRAAKAEGRK